MQAASQLLPGGDYGSGSAGTSVDRARSERGWWRIRRGVVGVINLAQLERELAKGADQKLGEVVEAVVFPHVHSDQGLDLALERMGANQIEMLPVVNRADIHKLEGVVTLQDVLHAYGVDHA